MKRVFITGATSMIGVAFVKQCIQKEVYVTAIDRYNSVNSKRIPESRYVEIADCDLDYMSKYTSSKQFDAFYHFAWSNTDKNNRFDPELQEKNIQYTLDAVNLAEKLGCRAFIGAGSQAEYGISTQTILPDSPVNPVMAYGVAKYSAGKLSSLSCNRKGLRHVWGRIFSSYGLYDKQETMIMYVIDSLLKRNAPDLTMCEQLWDYIFCDDVARAFFLMGKNGGKSAVYNVASGQAKPLVEYIKIIRDCIDANLELGIGNKPYSSDQIMHLCGDISNLTEDTGFLPQTSFRDGIIQTINWYKEYLDNEKN